MTNTPNKARIVVLISGSGSNLQSLIDATQSGQIHGDIVAVICNRPNAYGLTRANKARIHNLCLDHQQFDSREAFDQQLDKQIASFEPDLVILAGFMRILTSDFVSNYQGRLLNIHPSLLPKYPGLHTHQRAIDAGDKEHGATVHFVTEDLDSGAAIVQAAINIRPGDDAESLAQRLLQQEHVIYPLAAEWFCSGRLTYHNGQAQLDGQALPTSGQRLATNNQD